MMLAIIFKTWSFLLQEVILKIKISIIRVIHLQYFVSSIVQFLKTKQNKTNFTF